MPKDKHPLLPLFRPTEQQMADRAYLNTSNHRKTSMARRVSQHVSLILHEYSVGFTYLEISTRYPEYNWDSTYIKKMVHHARKRGDMRASKENHDAAKRKRMERAKTT